MPGDHGDLNFTEELDLQQQLDSTRNSYRKAVKKLSDEQTLTARLEAEIRMSDLSIKTLEGQHATEKELNTNLTGQIRNLMEQVSSLNNQIESLQRENQTLQSVIAQFKGIRIKQESDKLQETVRLSRRHLYYDEDDDIIVKGNAYRESGLGWIQKR